MGLVYQNSSNLESTFLSFLENSPNPVWAINSNYSTIAYNQSFKDLHRLFFKSEFDENTNILGLLDLKEEDDFKEWKKDLEKVLRGERFKKNREYQLKGKTLCFDFFFNPIKEDGKIVGATVTVMDVTNRKHLEEAIKVKKEKTVEIEQKVNTDEELIKNLRKENERFIWENNKLKFMHENFGVGFWEWDLLTDKLKVSKGFFEILEYKKDEFLPTRASLEKQVHPEDKTRVSEILQRIIDGKNEQFDCEFRILTKTGNWVWVSFAAKVLEHENNKANYVVGTISDISLKKNTQTMLKELEDRFFYLADHLPFMIWMTDRNSQSTYFNKAWLEFRNRSLESELETIPEDRIHLDDIDYYNSVLKNAYAEKTKFNVEYRLKTGEGEYKWVFDQGIPRFLSNGEFIGFIGATLDINERKIIANQLMESETKLKEITSVLGEGIFVLDKNGYVDFINPEFTNLLGWDAKDLEGRTLHSLVHVMHETENEPHDCPITRALVTGEIYRIREDYFKQKDGDLLPVSYVTSPIVRNGEIIGTVTAFHDIKERKEYEAEIERFVEELQINRDLIEENAQQMIELNQKLMESEQQLKELNANKDKFFSIISHDLKSPFTSLLGFAEYLVEDLDELSKEEIKEFSTNIYKSAKNIFNLLENLLQWSRIQSGKIQYTPSQFSLTSLIDTIIALFQVNATKKKVKLINEVTDEITVFADKFMVDAVIRNLLSNAIKFTKAGGEVRIKVMEKDDMLYVSVKDDGVGMKEEIKNKLFKIDQHVTTKGTEQEKGTGLGLILSKEFVEKNGGEIWVETEEGKGSEFIFTLPVWKEEVKANTERKVS